MSTVITCGRCGEVVTGAAGEVVRFCPRCGHRLAVIPDPYGGMAEGYSVRIGGAGETDSDAVAALVIGLVGLSFPLLGPVAWWLGAKAKERIAAAPDALTGHGLAVAGWVLGIIESAFLALFLLGFCIISSCALAAPLVAF